MNSVESYWESMDKDLKAFGAVLRALEGLEKDDQGRVLRWVAEKLGTGHLKGAKKETASEEESGGEGLGEFDSAADALGASRANTDTERALVVAAYLSKKTGETLLTGRQINNELKQAGHESTNISRDITSLMERKPRLMIQMSKSGKTQQAWKKYKVTAPGYAAVDRLLQTPE